MLIDSKKLLRWCSSFALSSTFAISGPVQADPYPGEAVQLPGKVDLENYDTGGQNVSYFDLTTGNTFGTYRSDDVDIVAGNDNITYIADTQAGEWLQYSVDVRGTVTGVQAVVASVGPGGTFHLEFRGPSGQPVVSSQIQIPDTGGWQNWTTVGTHFDVSPERGINTMRVVLDSNGASGYVGSMDSVSFLYLTNPSLSNAFVQGNQIPGTIQAEHYDIRGEGASYHDSDFGNSFNAYRNDDVDIVHSRDANFYLGNTKASEWLEYTVVTSGFSTTAQLRVASDGEGGIVHLEEGGRDISGPIKIPDTGGWQNWVMVTAPLSTGSMPGPVTSVRLVFDSNGPTGYVGSIDFIRFMFAGTTQHADYLSEEMPITSIRAVRYDQGGEGVAYHDTTEGNQYHQARHEDVDIVDPDNGIPYLAETKAGEWLEYTTWSGSEYDAVILISAASMGQGGVAHVEVDGIDVTGPIVINDTGGWQQFQEHRATRTFRLTQGSHLVRLVMDQDGPTGYVGAIRSISAAR